MVPLLLMIYREQLSWRRGCWLLLMCQATNLLWSELAQAGKVSGLQLPGCPRSPTQLSSAGLLCMEVSPRKVVSQGKAGFLFCTLCSISPNDSIFFFISNSLSRTSFFIASVFRIFICHLKFRIQRTLSVAWTSTCPLLPLHLSVESRVFRRAWRGTLCIVYVVVWLCLWKFGQEGEREIVRVSWVKRRAGSLVGSDCGIVLQTQNF